MTNDGENWDEISRIKSNLSDKSMETQIESDLETLYQKVNDRIKTNGKIDNLDLILALLKDTNDSNAGRFFKKIIGYLFIITTKTRDEKDAAIAAVRAIFYEILIDYFDRCKKEDDLRGEISGGYNGGYANLIKTLIALEYFTEPTQEMKWAMENNDDTLLEVLVKDIGNKVPTVKTEADILLSREIGRLESENQDANGGRINCLKKIRNHVR
jgi:hypothetical protein